MTMKHNNSNNSIHSTKKMIATIRKPNDFMGVGAGASLLGQSTQHALSSKKNNNNVQAGGLLQQSSTSNYTSPYSQKNAGAPVLANKNIH
jgi:hypothetical protein